MDRRIEQEWKNYVESLYYGRTIPKQLYDMLRASFHVGFIITFHILVNELSDSSKDEVIHMLDSLGKEAVDFTKEIRMKAEAAEEKNKSENV